MLGFLTRLFGRQESQKPPLRFRNTLSGELEVFVPIGGPVKMYNCGPTVYGTQHIGNMRAAVFADLIRRVLRHWGYQVKQVINITDFGHLSSDADEGEDKMTAGLRREGLELSLENMRLLAEKYATEYFADIESLGLPVAQISFPRASDYIGDQIALINTLEEKGYAYRTMRGVYFDTSKFREYGKLGNINLKGLKGGARVGEDQEKRNPTDFVLWKSDAHLGWDSPWGKGFPGWHIECTAMIFKLLGRQIDIHTGGIEHIPVHHNNEIAQAEAATGKQFVRYWMHNDHITIEGKKISKSLGNTVYLHNITDRGISPLAYRYLLLTAHYRSPLNFTWTALEGASQALMRLSRLFYEELPKTGSPTSAFMERFDAIMAEDLNTPAAVAFMWDMLKDPNVSPQEKRGNILYADRIFGLGFAGKKKPNEMKSLTVIAHDALPEDVRAKVEARETARAEKNFEEADRLREELKAAGYEIKDTESGPSVIDTRT